MKVKDVAIRHFWINENGLSEWYEDISECPHSNKDVKYVTHDGENELTIEV